MKVYTDVFEIEASDAGEVLNTDGIRVAWLHVMTWGTRKLSTSRAN